MNKKKKTIIVSITAGICTVILALLAWALVGILNADYDTGTTETVIGSDSTVYATKVIEVTKTDGGVITSKQTLNRDPTTEERAMLKSARESGE